MIGPRKTKRKQSPVEWPARRGCGDGGGSYEMDAERQRVGVFRERPRKARFHACGHGATVASVPSFASQEACEELVALAEALGFGTEVGSSGRSYTQATEDLEVDACPLIRSWLQRRRLVPSVAACMRRTHGVAPTAFDDIFIVKYDARRQASLRWHVDAGDVSFMLALSPRSAYEGGGTTFKVRLRPRSRARGVEQPDHNWPAGHQEAKGNTGGPCSTVRHARGTEELLHLDQGELLLFDAGLFHAGLPITVGTRYLLVGFCFVEPGATRVPGNDGLNLHRLHGSDSSFDLWRLHYQGTAGCHWRPELAGLLVPALALYRRQEAHSLSPASCWVSADAATEKGTLAAFAQDVFWFHARRLGMACSSSSTAGAEYWVQCVATAAPRQHGDTHAEEAEAIPWHCDKDEAQLKATGVLRHPAVATVTYLTSGGVPTVVFGERQTLVSFPREGNHLAFVGNLLHGCPCDLDIAGRGTVSGGGPAWGLRTTLLVNLWPASPPDRSTFLEVQLPSSAASTATPAANGGPATAAAPMPSGLSASLVAWEEIRVKHPTLSDLGLDDPEAVLQQLLSRAPSCLLDGKKGAGGGGGVREGGARRGGGEGKEGGAMADAFLLVQGQ